MRKRKHWIPLLYQKIALPTSFIIFDGVWKLTDLRYMGTFYFDNPSTLSKWHFMDTLEVMLHLRLGVQLISQAWSHANKRKHWRSVGVLSDITTKVLVKCYVYSQIPGQYHSFSSADKTTVFSSFDQTFFHFQPMLIFQILVWDISEHMLFNPRLLFLWEKISYVSHYVWKPEHIPSAHYKNFDYTWGFS